MSRVAITGGTGFVARAQVEILAEGVVDPLPFADVPPPDLALTRTPLSPEVIRAGVPPAGGFGRADLRWYRAREAG